MRNASFGEFIVAAFLVCYLMICFSPLRLEYDSIQYFSLKDCLEYHCPAGFVAAADPHPYGYPVLLWLLSRAGLLHPFVIAFVNLLFLAGALFFIIRLFRSSLSSRKLESGIILLLLSYPIVKFFSYPLSEMQYLFFSCGSLYFFYLYTDRGRRPGALVLALVFAGLAIVTRSAGLVMIPALLAGLVWPYRKAALKRWGWMAAGVAVVVAVLFVSFSRRIHMGLYVNSMQISGASWKVLLREHFSEWGEMLLNFPASKLPRGLPFFIGLGVFFVGVVVFCLIRWGKKMPVSINVYLVCYSLLIFYWPFYDVRFWIPVLPFIIMLLMYAVIPRPMMILYVLMGLIALGYSCYTSFSKETLARTQAGGRYRNEYETYFFGKPISDSTKKTDPYVLKILETCN